MITVKGDLNPQWFSLFLQIKDDIARIANANEQIAAELKKMNEPPPRKPTALRFTAIGPPINED